MIGARTARRTSAERAFGADAQRGGVMLLAAPVDDVNCYFTFVVWRNDDFSVSSEAVIAFDRAIGEEDRRMLERVPGALPLSQTGVVGVQADKGSVEWRRRFAAMLNTTATPRHA